MFRKLRLRLMLVNLSVIFVLFCLLIIGTYFYVQGKMTNGREHIMKRTAEDVLREDDSHRPPGPPPGSPGPVVFYAKVNTLLTIIDTSPFVPLSFKQLTQAVNQAHDSAPGTIITIEDRAELAFHKAPLRDSAGTLFVFADYHRDREILQLLLTALGIIGLICMLLSLLGSYFMANKAMAPIQRAWQQQQDFLADASHELRTPLAVIQTNLDVVRDAPAETVNSQMRWLNNIHEDVQCLTNLVESLLFLSQADSNQQFLKKKMFALDKAMLAAVEPFRPVALLKGVDLVARATGSVLYQGDELKLRQAMGILLDNAIRHTPLHGKISINMEIVQGSIVLTVSDTGEGIPAEDIDKIFLRFYQSDPSRSTGGAGLGLAIAKWIVESHGGVIKVTSTLGEGAIFTIWLPHVA